MNARYVVSRAVLTAVLGAALYAGGLPWWGAVVACLGALVFFLLAPRCGRYVVKDDGGAAPLRRDERTRAIRDQAARNAFILTVLALAGLAIAYGLILDAAVPVSALGGVLGLAALAYAVSDLRLRRSE
jgi:1,4-dihydroxy-2-naphthoate octaprenyltransferase